MGQLKKVATAVVALAAATLAMAQFSGAQAALSAGCQATSASYIDNSVSGQTFSGFGVPHGPFNPGEVVTINVTAASNIISGSFVFNDFTAGNIAKITVPLSGPSTGTYTIPAALAGDSFYPIYGYTHGVGSYSLAVTVSCAAAPSASSSTIQQTGSQFEMLNSNLALNDMLDQVIQNSSGAQFQSLSGGPNGMGVMVAPGQRVSPTADVPSMVSDSPWRMFIAGRYNGATGGLSGNQFNGIFGVSHRMGATGSFGLFGDYESFSYSDATPSTLSGNGETVGAFAAGSFNRLKLDAKAYTTFMSYNILTGGNTGAFGAQRYAGTGTASYEVASGATSFAPFIRGTGLLENQAAYTDSGGIAVAAANLSEGVLASGIRLAHTAAMNGGNLTPYVAVEGDYIFGNQILAGYTASTGLSGKVNAGATFVTAHGISLGIDGGYSGIGSSIGSWTAQATFSVPF